MTVGRWLVPDSWEWVRSETIAEIVGGGTPRADDESNFSADGIPWITPADLTGYRSAYIGRGRRDLSDKGIKGSGATLLPAGTVLFSSRAPVGYCAIAANAISTNQGFKSLVLNGDLSPEFVRYYLLSAKEYAESLASGTTFLELSAKRMCELEIPLPPLTEQRRIVRKLDTLDARSATARTHLAAIEKLVERYKLAVLRGAYFVDASGTLNEEEARGFGWDIRPLGQSLENLDNRRIPIKAEDRQKRRGPYDYYGASGVIDKIDEYLFDGRYLLIGEDGANLVARSSPIAFIAEGQFWVNNHAHVLGETPYACLDWVRLYFAAIKLESFVTGSAQPKLTQSNLNKIPVPLPAPDEQRKIVRRIETAFAKIDRLAAEAAKALKLLGRLDQRILAKAFAGELVPQNPDDEPAETLLARIRAERLAQPKPRPGRRAKHRV